MNVINKVTSCYQSCPFYSNSMDGMYCGHPYWKDKSAYSEMIITQSNSKGRVPDKCPLKKEALTIKYTLS